MAAWPSAIRDDERRTSRKDRPRASTGAGHRLGSSSRRTRYEERVRGPRCADRLTRARAKASLDSVLTNDVRFMWGSAWRTADRFSSPGQPPAWEDERRDRGRAREVVHTAARTWSRTASLSVRYTTRRSTLERSRSPTITRSWCPAIFRGGGEWLARFLRVSGPLSWDRKRASLRSVRTLRGTARRCTAGRIVCSGERSKSDGAGDRLPPVSFAM